jgi:hypothetical protein
LLFNLLGRCLDVRLDSLEVIVVFHLGAGISDDFDAGGQEAIAEESKKSRECLLLCLLLSPVVSLVSRSWSDVRDRMAGMRRTKSPLAPRTTMTVFSLSSTELGNVSAMMGIYHFISAMHLFQEA